MPVTDLPIHESTSNTVKLNIINVVNNSIIKIADDIAYTTNTPKYINNYGNTFSIIKFRYYISNIKLKKQDGAYFIEENSCHLIDTADTNKHVN